MFSFIRAVFSQPCGVSSKMPASESRDKAFEIDRQTIFSVNPLAYLPGFGDESGSGLPGYTGSRSIERLSEISSIIEIEGRQFLKMLLSLLQFYQKLIKAG